ncbi:MAG: hypothetical protein DRH76_07495 [Deltaproteobacteria bacterium]|nr:MAG: hypothetical protein DRH76_07495 [Deltaproteobacteria bacterium]
MEEQQFNKRFYLVIDFEANCSKENTRDHEIIEFPAVLVDARTGSQLAEFREFVHTIKTGPVSEFITQLTGITTTLLKSEAVRWSTCLTLFDAWCEHHGINANTTTIVTCGDWDLKTMLPRQLSITQTQPTQRVMNLFGCWNNVKVTHRNAHRYKRSMGMARILEDMKIELTGRHHSGIDDCRNIAKICHALSIRKGCDMTRPNRLLEVTCWFLPRPIYRRSKNGKIIKNLI